MTYDVSFMTQDGLAALRGDCERMVPHWVLPRAPWEVRQPHPAVGAAGIHGVVVPASSARLIDAMADFAD
ncbi:hypothetical protein ACIBUY_21485 [Streptomyces sp. NPDC050085]|uniref:hypothetical protein n=1 Tax=Streptomyces sp. NPDC050085 TaxID=3365600 RepID=UPI0037B9A1CC